MQEMAHSLNLAEHSKQITPQEGPAPTLLTKAKSNFQDRFIPDRIQNHYPLLYLPTPSQDLIGPSPSLNNYQSIYLQHVVGKNQQNSDQPIHIFQNRNLLHFGKKAKENCHLSCSSLSGMELRHELTSFKNPSRKIKNTPLKILQAPALQDDFYLNLIDWSPKNLIAIGLSTNVFLRNFINGQTFKLCKLGPANSCASVGFCQNNNLLAIGTYSGIVSIWDLQKATEIRSLEGHMERVGSISWVSTILSTGSKDKSILQRDIRCHQPYFSKLSSHAQQICGLKWSFDQQYLCSGGNDNKLVLWSKQSQKPLTVFDDHHAAVKAIAWSPHQHGLVASGGGIADKTIKFRNVLTGQTIKSWDTHSQICNLAFSTSLNELVSTHGYSQNQVAIWNYPTDKRIASLTGHSSRVLYLAMSPDSSIALTGSADQTIRFWQIFPQTQHIHSQCSLEGCHSIIR